MYKIKQFYPKGGRLDNLESIDQMMIISRDKKLFCNDRMEEWSQRLQNTKLKGAYILDDITESL